MKKLFALLAVALGVVACQKDQVDMGVNMGGEQEVMINVSLPDESRADSAKGFDLTTLATDPEYQLRYILEIYRDGGTDDQKYRDVKYSDDTSVSFSVRLVPGYKYTFAVWADVVSQTNPTDLYYNAASLKNISINESNWTAMDEKRDAFYGNFTLADGAQVAGMGAITLTRPFAKVRVVTTDIEDLDKIGLDLPTEAKVTYKTTINNKFNALSGEASSDNATMEYPFIYANSSYTDAEGEMTLFADYLFVNAGATTKFDLAVTGHVTKSFNTDIPVVANQVTTIKGDFLTNGGDINVDINDKFDTETIYLEGNVTLTENLNVNRPLVVAAGKTAVLNLNNKNIINTNRSENYGEGEGIVVYGNLTIEGEGTIQGTSMAVWARGNNNAVVTIKGGTFVGCGADLEGGRSVVYASSGNVVNIYGGEFKAEAADETSFAATQYPVLNVADNNGMINVYGGRFYKQNPAAPGTEPAAWNANHPNGFVALGYIAEQDNDWYNVKTAPLAVTGVVDYNGGEIVVTESPENTASTYGIVCPEGTTTIKNLTIDGGNFKTTNGKGLRGIYVDNEADVTLENVVVKNVTYAINVNTTKTVKLTVKNSTLEGWTSYGGSTTASFDNVKFECGVYANFKPYSATTLTNCSFEAGFQIDVTSLNGVITLKNCKYNGVVLTAENFATVAKYDGDITGKIAF